MPSPDIPYLAREDGYDIDYDKTIEYENEKWYNRIWVRKVLGGHYKVFIKTRVTNKGTQESSYEKTYSIVIDERGFIRTKLLGHPRYKKKDLPDIQKNIRNQVKKLAEKNKTMKSEEELLAEVSQEFENQMKNVDFESAVEEVRK